MKYCIACVMLMALMANAAEPTTAPEDARFAHPHDKDHPWGFTADYSDSRAWVASYFNTTWLAIATAPRSRIAKDSSTPRRCCGCKASWACRRGTASDRWISF